MVNAPPITTGRALDLLLAGWDAQRQGALTTSWMLHGRPGIGKTEVVQTLASRIGARLYDLRLTTIEPQDLRGLPFFDMDRQRTIWFRPEDLPDDPTTPSVLFLDELTAAAPQLQPTVYGLLQERRVGPHRLPDSCFVVAAGNTVEDGAIAYEMGSALSDRLVHLNLVAEAGDWVQGFAVPQGLDPAVIAFIRTRPDLLDTNEAALRRGDMIACTPRSWARASALMGALPDRALRNTAIAGVLGEAVAAEFLLIADEIAATVQLDDLLEATAKARAELYPPSMHGMTALIYALVARADAGNMGVIIEIMAEARSLRAPPFSAMPLAELGAHGFEMLIRKALDNDMAEAFLDSSAYAAYAEERRAAGLE
ncbi:MoxR family ATPase [Roseibaca sp. V10]|uniref:MoxR family ATPase n=1 Tax=Roseinatronobacter domitianus TaxID=2940293 RepID=A0ABT0M1E3_9RHOB|nr:MoxR family ATPase [Roseibaca domitiana]MCL1628682.1 MoxR family ATPase [Roseibaca domitiana]